MPTDADILDAQGLDYQIQFAGKTVTYTEPDVTPRDLQALVSTIETIQQTRSEGGIDEIDRGTLRLPADASVGVTSLNLAATVTIDGIDYNVSGGAKDGGSFVLMIYRIRPQEVGLGLHH